MNTSSIVLITFSRAILSLSLISFSYSNISNPLSAFYINSISSSSKSSSFSYIISSLSYILYYEVLSLECMLLDPNSECSSIPLSPVSFFLILLIFLWISFILLLAIHSGIQKNITFIS